MYWRALYITKALARPIKPIGEWNTLHIKMVGEKVSVWLNGKQTVDNQVLDNYFDRKKEIVASGAIELQTHGSEIRFRDIYLKELPAASSP